MLVIAAAWQSGPDALDDNSLQEEAVRLGVTGRTHWMR
jgi:hypothetical protein